MLTAICCYLAGCAIVKGTQAVTAPETPDRVGFLLGCGFCLGSAIYLFPLAF